MKDGEVSITLTRLARYIQKANDATDEIKSKRAEIHRLEDQIFSLKCDLADGNDALDFYNDQVTEMKAAAIDEGYAEKYLRQFMKDRKYKPYLTY